MLALDLFCGAGGAGRGIANCGYDVWGIDITYQPSYPFEFLQEDAIQFMQDGLDPFDFIWASPPCQAYSFASARHRNSGKEYPDLVDITRKYLQESGKPYIIENVIGAPLINPVRLCGTQFKELKVFRHRIFESNIDLKTPGKCSHKEHKAISRRGDGGDFYTVAGHMPGTKKEWSDAMGID